MITPESLGVTGPLASPSPYPAVLDLRRRCLLRLGAALLSGGLPVQEVEDELRQLGPALDAPDIRVAAMPTGLFVGMGPDDAVGFEPVGPGLRFDQTAEVLNLLHRLRAGESTSHQVVEALDAVYETPARLPAWLSDFGAVPVGVGIGLILQPGVANVAATVIGSVLVALLMNLSRRSALLRTLLPVVAAFLIGGLVLFAAEAGLLEGPLRTMIAPLAMLLPGAVIVTGMSELAAGAAIAGTSRLVSGTVQLLLFAIGLFAAVTVMGVDLNTLTNLRVNELGAWAPWAGVALIGVGVLLNVCAPRSALPWIFAVLLLTYFVQSTVQAAGSAALGGLVGAAVAALAAAVVQRLPAGPFSLMVFLPAFWVLVPGSLGLLSTAELATGTGEGLRAVGSTVTAVIGVALGSLIGAMIGRILFPLPTAPKSRP